MNIKFKLKDAPIEYKLNSENKISEIYSYMVDKLNELEIKINNDYKITEIESPENVNINIILVNGPEAFNYYFESDIAEKTYGVFNISNGDGLLGEEYLAKEFSVLVDASYDSFKNAYKNFSNYDKVDFISRYLVTLTHEINHALEFIENSGGLTPYQVEDYFDAGLFDYTVDDCCTGYGLPKYFDDFDGIDDEDEIYQIMEDRVENKGRYMFKDLNIPLEKIKSLIPKEKNINKIK